MAAEEMAESDHELFIEMLVKLDGTHDSVKAASKWCRANAAHHDVIVKTWFWALAKSRTMNRRLDLFHLASDILFTADSQSLPFFCSFLPIFVKAIPLVRGEEIKLSMAKLLSLWREKNIYNEDVMDELEKSLRNRNKVVDNDVFYYDQDLLIANSMRIYKLKPAVDFLRSEVDNSQTFDNIPVLLGNIKDRRTCASLFRAVDNQKKRVKTLVDFLEEMVHLLKMTTGDLDMAANREQNGVETVKLKLMGYERFGQKVRSVQDTLISVHHVPPPEKKSPPRVNELLFVRRPPTKVPEIPPSPQFSPEKGVPPIGSTTPSRELNFVEPNFMVAPPMGGFYTPAVNVINPLFPPQIPYVAPLVPPRESFEPSVGSITPLRDEGFVLPIETRRYSYPVGVGTPRHDPWAGSTTPVVDEIDIPIGSLTPRRNSFDKPSGSLTPRNEEYNMPWGSESYSGPSSVPVASDPRMRRSMPVYSMAGSYDPPSGASTPRHDSFANAPVPSDLPVARRPPLLPTPDLNELPPVDRRRGSTPARERAMTPGREMAERGRTPGRDFPRQDRSRATTPRRERSVSREERGRTPGREFPMQDRSRAMTPGRDRAMAPGRDRPDDVMGFQDRGRNPGRDFPVQDRRRAMTPGRDIQSDDNPIFSRRDRRAIADFPDRDRSRAMTPGRDHRGGPGGDRGRTPGRDFPMQDRSRAMTPGRDWSGPGGDRGRTTGRDFQDRSRAMTPGRDQSGPGEDRGRTPGRDFPMQDRSRAITPGRDWSGPGEDLGRIPGRDFHDRSRAMTPGRGWSGPGEDRGRAPERDFKDRSQAMTPGRDQSGPGGDRGRTPGRDFPMQDRSRAMTPGRDRTLGPGGDRGRTPGRDFQDRSRATTPGRDRSGPGGDRGRTPGRDFPMQDRSQGIAPVRDPRKINPQDSSRPTTSGTDRPINDPRIACEGNPDVSKDKGEEKTLEPAQKTDSDKSDIVTDSKQKPAVESKTPETSKNTAAIDQAKAPDQEDILSTSSDGELPSSKESDGEKTPERELPSEKSVVTPQKVIPPPTIEILSDEEDAGVGTGVTKKEDTLKSQHAPTSEPATIKKTPFNPYGGGKEDSALKTEFKKDLPKPGGNQSQVKTGVPASRKTLYRGSLTQRGRGKDFNSGDRFAAKSYQSSGQVRGKFVPRGKSVRPNLNRDRIPESQSYWKRGNREPSPQRDSYANQQQGDFQSRNPGQQRSRPKRMRNRRRASTEANSLPSPWDQRNSLPALINSAIHDNSQGESIFDKLRSTIFDRARSLTPSRDPSPSSSRSPRFEGSPARDSSWGSFWGSGNSNRPVYQPEFTGLPTNAIRPESRIRPLMQFPFQNDNRGFPPSGYR